MAIYQVRVVQDGRTTARKQLSSGLANGEAAVIKAQAGATYVIQNSLAGADEKGAPAKIVAKRVGQNLHIAIEQEEKSFFDFLRGKKTKANPDVPDLVIEAYFDHPPASVVGALEGGGYAAYDLTAITPAGLNVPPAGEGASHGQAGFASYSGPVISDLPQQDWIGGLSGLQVTGIGLAGLAGLALVVAADQGDGNLAAPTPDPVIAAQNTINAYATDPKNTPPTLANYTTLGVTGVTSTNLAAINSAIDALDASKVDSKAKVQTVVDAYVKILAEANGSAADLTPGTNPATEDYATIGVTLGFSANKVYETNELSLLNDVIGSLSTTAVDTVAEINAIAAVVVKVMTLAAGPTANMPALTTPLTVSDLVLIGLPNSGAGAVSDSNIAAIQSALSALSDNGGQLKVDTFGELKALVVAVASIVNYANDSTQAIPTYSNYADMGVTGVTATNVGAINSAVDAHTGSMADTKAKIQSIVDDYLAIIAEANGTAA
ncbi:MAG: hypothetical protein RLZZ123_2187, partial [Pseudomonadota bacterium]